MKEVTFPRYQCNFGEYLTTHVVSGLLAAEAGLMFARPGRYQTVSLGPVYPERVYLVDAAGPPDKAMLISQSGETVQLPTLQAPGDSDDGKRLAQPQGQRRTVRRCQFEYTDLHQGFVRLDKIEGKCVSALTELLRGRGADEGYSLDGVSLARAKMVSDVYEPVPEGVYELRLESLGRDERGRLDVIWSLVSESCKRVFFVTRDTLIARETETQELLAVEDDLVFRLGGGTRAPSRDQAGN